MHASIDFIEIPNEVFISCLIDEDSKFLSVSSVCETGDIGKCIILVLIL